MMFGIVGCSLTLLMGSDVPPKETAMPVTRTVREQIRRARIPPAVERVVSRIRELLVARTLRPGDRLPSEGELGELLAVGRGSIREAMKILSGYGVVTVRAGDGTYVATEAQGGLIDPMLFQMLLSSPDRRSLLELRQLLELGMVPLLAEHVTDTDVSDLRASLGQTGELVEAQCRDPEMLTDADIDFHRCLGRSVHNPLVERIYAFAMDFLRPTIRDTYVRNQTGDLALAMHGRIVAALESRDVEQLRTAVAQSIDVWEHSRGGPDGTCAATAAHRAPSDCG